MISVRMFLGLLAVSAGACASNPSPDTGAMVTLSNPTPGNAVERMPDGSIRDTITGSKDQVVKALNVAYTALGLAVDLYNPQSGAVGSQNARFLHSFAGRPVTRFFDCGQVGGTDRADRWAVYASAVSQVITTQPAGLAVNTRVVAYTQDPSGSAERIPCESAGRLETLIMETARQKLTPGK